MFRWMAAAIILGLVACTAASTGVRSARRASEAGNPERAAQELERIKAATPANFEVRLELGIVYYKLARKALDADQQEEYVSHLSKSLDEFIEAARIEPESPRPHTWMGIVIAYKDDLDGSLQSFKNALRLDPRQPVAYMNIAQLHLYLGSISRSRNWIEKAKRKGAGGVYVELLEALVAWRQGDMVEARDLFELAYGLSPEDVNTWDEAPVDEPIEGFDDFTAYCCSNHTCGPHMGKACARVQLAVKERELRAETIREELVIEMERRRKLQEIYEGRRDLTIEVESPEDQ